MRLNQEHKLLCNVLTVFVLLLILTGGLYLIELSRTLEPPNNSRAKILGEFLAKGAFLVIVLDLFLMKFSRRHIVEEFTEKVREPIEAAQRDLEARFDLLNEQTIQNTKAIVKAYLKIFQAHLTRVIQRDHSQLSKSIAELDNHIDDLENQMDDLEVCLKSTVQTLDRILERVDNSQHELTGEILELRGQIQTYLQSSFGPLE